MSWLGGYPGGASRGVKRAADEAGYDGANGDSSRKRFDSGPSFRQRKMCTFFMQGRCNKGDQCTYSHDEEEPVKGADQGHAALDGGLDDEGADFPADEFAEQDEFDAADAEISRQLGSGPVPSRAPKVFGSYLDAAEKEAEAEAEAEVEAEADDYGEPAAEEDVSMPSSAVGPRDLDAKPRQLCRFWLRHPVFCKKGDVCPYAHGLQEMGVDSRGGVVIRVTDRSATISQEEQGYGSGGPDYYSSGGKSKDSGGKSKGGAKGGSADWTTSHYSSGAKGYLSSASSGKMSTGKGKGGGKGGPGMQALGAPPVGSYSAEGKGSFMGKQGRFDPAKGLYHPTKICTFWLQDPSLCTRGDDCTFAHGVQELQSRAAETCGVSRFHHNPAKPTKLCTYFQNNACTRGLACTFAHDPSEMASGRY